MHKSFSYFHIVSAPFFTEICAILLSKSQWWIRFNILLSCRRWLDDSFIPVFPKTSRVLMGLSKGQRCTKDVLHMGNTPMLHSDTPKSVRLLFCRQLPPLFAFKPLQRTTRAASLMISVMVAFLLPASD